MAKKHKRWLHKTWENFDLDDETSLPHISFWLQKYSVLKCSFGKSDTHILFFMNSSEEVVDVQVPEFFLHTDHPTKQSHQD